MWRWKHLQETLPRAAVTQETGRVKGSPILDVYDDDCRQFGHAPSNSFASPVLGSDLLHPLNFRYLTYEKWWNATVSGPRTPSSRA